MQSKSQDKIHFLAIRYFSESDVSGLSLDKKTYACLVNETLMTQP